ncbi:MAG: LysR family transcriptional regulator [Actinobacteria bacterium]|nr:LysR family transcriptional regulator [Actinomycetota bacterium]
MNTKSLRVLAEVARTGSFSAAARNLGLTQPAVSFHIRSLEKEYGCILVDRSLGRCRLTEPGQALLRHAQRILKVEEELAREMEGRRGEPSGSLLLAASNIPGEYILPRVLSRYRQRNPLVEPRLEITDTRGVLDLVRAGEVDLGCVGSRDDEERLEYGKLCADRLVFIAPGDHPLAKRKRISADDLTGETLILREEGSGTRSHMLRILSELGLDVSSLDSLVLGSTMAVIQAVAAGAGISVSSMWAVEPYARLGKVRMLPLSGADLRRDFFYVTLRRKPSTPAVEALVEVIEETRPELEDELTSFYRP